MGMIIEFLGLPRTGKSTTARLVARRLRAHGLTVKIINDRDVIASALLSHVPHSSPMWQVLFASEIVRRTLGTVADVVILERGLEDQEAWISCQRPYSTPTRTFKRTTMAHLRKIMPRSDAIFAFVNVTPSECVKRHEASGDRMVVDSAVLGDAGLMARLYSWYQEYAGGVRLDARYSTTHLADLVVEYLDLQAGSAVGSRKK